MAETLAPEVERSWVTAEVDVSRATWQAYQIMYYSFIALMGIAGLDKFFRLIASWDVYVTPGFASFMHMTPIGVSMLAGVIEIVAALAVALKPRVGSWVVTAWLWLVVINLLATGTYHDVAFADFILSMAGLAFTRLAAECN